MIKCLAIILGVGYLAAQTPAPAPTTTTVPDTVYMRRFTGGVSFGYSVKPALLTGEFSEYDSTNLIYTTSATTAEKNPLAGGVTLQYSFLESWAVNAGVLYREGAYESSTTYYNGTDNVNTAIDERKRTIQEETTRARFYDIPVLARYYGKSHYDPGLRWFGELGPNLRLTRGIRSQHRMENPLNLTSHNETPAKAKNPVVLGATAGFGVTFIDPFGIKYTPEVRFTRWMNQPFDSLSTQTNRNQIEIMLSVTF